MKTPVPPDSAVFVVHLRRQPTKTDEPVERGRTESEGGWQGASESAGSAKRGWFYVWRETGAFRSARPSRGRAACTQKRTEWIKDAKPTVAVSRKRNGFVVGETETEDLSLASQQILYSSIGRFTRGDCPNWRVVDRVLRNEETDVL